MAFSSPARTPSAVSRRKLLALPLGAGAIALLSTSPVRAANDEPVIAAAADLNFALKDVVERFTHDTGKSVKVTFGSSGNFATQIRQGAPFEVFLCADEEYVQALAKEGRTEGDGVLYAIGRIGLFALKNSPLKVDSDLSGLAAALRDGRIQKFAIANPEHAPYGRAARAALQHAGLWEQIEPKLVLGENVSQATQFAMSGSTEGGIIPLSLAKSSTVANAGSFALLSETWHPPLRQRMVLLKGAGPTAHAFYDYMQAPAALGVLKGYGFVLPGQEG